MAAKHKLLSVIEITKNFLALEAASGIILMLAALAALIAANSPLAGMYGDIFGRYSVKLAINDGLMAVFFFLVGLEIKREMAVGELSSRARALLPFLAAAGGMAVPALIYAGLNLTDKSTLGGWAIPSATDIAFSLGVFALLGSRVPLSLKILLTAIAIIDDLGAVIIIAVFYTAQVSLLWLAASAVLIAGLVGLNRSGSAFLPFYLMVGALLWLAMYKGGIHPTIAGVATAFFIPLQSQRDPDVRPLEHVEHVLHPYVAYAILPIFAFANAGVPFTGITAESFTEPVVTGIGLGLFAGKLIGIFTPLWLAIKFKLCPMPEGVSWRHLWGLAHVCGIGFTMSLFIGELAFSDSTLQADIRLGVLSGSILSALACYLVLRGGRGQATAGGV